LSPAYNTSREDFAPLLEELGLPPERVHLVDAADPGQDQGARVDEPGHLLISQIGYSPDVGHAIGTYRHRGDPLLGPDGAALFYLKGRRQPAELARWRNHLWPWLHVVAIAHIEGDGERAGVELETFQARRKLSATVTRKGHLLFARRREHVLSPQATVEKFAKNAEGWNPRAGSPGYAHYRWMRRFVGRFARAPRGARILDFGCGAGWVGIEAALATPQSALCLFDPSPELVAGALENARGAGLARVEARTGFGEDPPFPAAGEERFELVLSSGVVSFAPDRARWLDGLCRTVRPGGTLVIGDIHREARGMRRRRARKPLLPAREMNASTREEIAELLRQRGFALERQAGYQLTWPVPQLLHTADTRTKGLLSPPLVLLNRAAAALDARIGSPLPDAFDSWVLALRAP
jgi:SAM-dependent methyltransferase